MKEKEEVTFCHNTQFTGETIDSHRDDQCHMEFLEDTCDTSTQQQKQKVAMKVLQQVNHILQLILCSYDLLLHIYVCSHFSLLRIKSLQSVFVWVSFNNVFFFSGLHSIACWILVTQPGSNPSPLESKCSIVTTSSPRKFQILTIYNRFVCIFMV